MKNVAVTLFAVCALAGVHVRAGQDPPATATLRGRVVVERTGEPVRGATVEAESVGRDTSIALRATTDGQGRFELTELPPGQYHVSASRTGFVTRRLGQRAPFESVDPVAVRAGQTIAADFALTRGGAIAGRVFDPDVEPVAEVQVQVMRIQTIRGRRRLVPVGSPRLTDDLGVYRVYGLPPGEYLVGATIGPESLTVTGAGAPTLFVNGRIAPAGSTTSAYAPTYYPGTPRVAEAQRITVDVGEEEYYVNFALVAAPLVRVSGTVFNRSGDPIEARVELIPDIEGLRVRGHTTVSAPDGTFTLGGVAPGTYIVNAIGRIVEDNPPDVAWATTEVGAEDVSGLTIVTSNGSNITGRIITEGSSRVSTDGMRVFAQPVGAAAGRNDVAAAVSGGVFQLEGLIGPYALGLDRPPQGFVARSITANGVDVTDSTLEFRGADHVDLEVVLTDRLAALYGTVRADGRAEPRASVIVFPEDASRWTGASRAIRTTRTDQDGLFAIRGLLPNQRYLAVAVEYLNDGEEQDAEFLQRIRARASSLPASSDQNRTLDLTLVRR